MPAHEVTREKRGPINNSGYKASAISVWFPKLHYFALGKKRGFVYLHFFK